MWFTQKVLSNSKLAMLSTIKVFFFAAERNAVISVPQLCAYIFAILFEFSGIFNRLFRLNFLYFRRNTTLSIESGRTAFVTSPP